MAKPAARAAFTSLLESPTIKFQGQGIGGELMRFAEAKARENNFSELHLATHVLRKENISLYLHLGWEETGRDETRVFLKKEI